MLKKPVLRVSYNNVDITESIENKIQEFTYVDVLTGASPDIELLINDRDGLFQSDWFPDMKAKLDFTLSYEGEETEIGGEGFEIDRLSSSFSVTGGDTMSLGAQQTPFTKNLRQVITQDYENVSLKEVINAIALRQSLTPVGEVPSVTFARLTQNEVTDLEFLTRLSEEYGFLMKIEGDNLIFYSWAELDAAEAVFTLERRSLESLNAVKKIDGVYKSAQIVYQLPESEDTVEFEIAAQRPNDSDDILVLNLRAESVGQAQLIAIEKLRSANADEFSTTILLEGDYRHKAGVNFNLVGFGNYDGKWQIQEVRHSFVSGSGTSYWSSDLTAYRI